MNFVITTLLENCVYGRTLKAEHGLALHIQPEEGKTILFDTGQTCSFAQNAKTLNIDLSEVDYLILSHGHSDHTGGLSTFLEINRKAKVICKKELLARKFKNRRENGVTEIEKLDLGRFCFINRITELVPGVYVCPDIPLVHPEDTHFDEFFTEKDGIIVPDMFDDELGLFLVGNNRYAVLSACAHRGITNLLEQGKILFPNATPELLLGGFHIHTRGEEKYQPIARYLQGTPIQRIGICHCTGVDQFVRFAEDFGTKVFYNYTGRKICF